MREVEVFVWMLLDLTEEERKSLFSLMRSFLHLRGCEVPGTKRS